MADKHPLPITPRPCDAISLVGRRSSPTSASRPGAGESSYERHCEAAEPACLLKFVKRIDLNWVPNRRVSILVPKHRIAALGPRYLRDREGLGLRNSDPHIDSRQPRAAYRTSSPA